MEIGLLIGRALGGIIANTIFAFILYYVFQYLVIIYNAIIKRVSERPSKFALLSMLFFMISKIVIEPIIFHSYAQMAGVGVESIYRFDWGSYIYGVIGALIVVYYEANKRKL